MSHPFNLVVFTLQKNIVYGAKHLVTATLGQRQICLGKQFEFWLRCTGLDIRT
jgi:hypothetical protein